MSGVYFFTFRAYGTWLHGSEEGSMDRRHNTVGGPLVPASEANRIVSRRLMTEEPVRFTPEMRSLIDRTIVEVAEFRGWALLAKHVRTTHVHVVVSCDCSPEKAMGDLKARCTRRLREAGLITPGGKVWSRHGSTRCLFSQSDIDQIVDYVLNRQGQALPEAGRRPGRP